MTKKTAKRKSTAGKSKKNLEAPTESSFAAAVWTGKITRLRVYDKQTSNGKVFAYKAPGNNADYVGHSDDPNIVHALFLARDNGRTIMGYTDANFRINWLDY
jgi:hypothetical protein